AAPADGPGQTAVVLFYRYENLGQRRSQELAAQQRALGERLRLVGRVLVAGEGINGTVQGRAEAVAEYEAAVETTLGVGIDWKRSTAGAEALFPDFAVKEVAELVSFGLPDMERQNVSWSVSFRTPEDCRSSGAGLPLPALLASAPRAPGRGRCTQRISAGGEAVRRPRTSDGSRLRMWLSLVLP
ncbi:unnamed protein product, partial [Prorocentrum cordatum]